MATSLHWMLKFLLEHDRYKRSEEDLMLKTAPTRSTETGSTRRVHTEPKTTDKAQTAQRSARGRPESGQTSLSDALSRARAGIQTYAANHWARLNSVPIPDKKNGPRDEQRPVSPQGPQARPTPRETSTMGLSPLAQNTPSDNPQDEEEPEPQGREGIPQHIPHRRFTRPKGVSAMRGAASAWISFFDAFRH